MDGRLVPAEEDVGDEQDGSEDAEGEVVEDGAMMAGVDVVLAVVVVE